MSPFAFEAALVALLLTPGPTNTMLFTAGLAAGPRSAFRLLGAELMAYLCAVVAYGYVLQPLLLSYPALTAALRIAAALYLLLAAAKLWRGQTPLVTARVVTPAMVATATLLNPKALIIATVIAPAGWTADVTTAIPVLIALAATIPAIGALWFHAGLLAGRHGPARLLRLAPRISAAILATFALLLARSAA